MAQRTDSGSPSVPDWLSEVFGPAARRAERLGWGFRNETWAVRLPDGRRVAATRLADPAVAAILPARIASLRPLLVEAGLPVPAIVEIEPPPDGVLLTEFVDGIPGPELLNRVGGPATVGALLGAAWRRLGTIDATELALPALWASRDGLVAAARRWAGGVLPDLQAADRARLEIELLVLPGLLRERPVGLVHGDLVPSNILVLDDRLVALLDLESVRLADPLVDAAWFDWIVWFHHRSEEPAAWAAFATAAGLDGRDPVTAGLLRTYPLIRLLEILDGSAPGDRHRRRWLDQLVACLRRPGG